MSGRKVRVQIALGVQRLLLGDNWLDKGDWGLRIGGTLDISDITCTPAL
jgi:hypothetical protein